MHASIMRPDADFGIQVKKDFQKVDIAINCAGKASKDLRSKRPAP